MPLTPAAAYNKVRVSAMPAFGHLGDAVNDLAFTQGLMAKESVSAPKYARRRIAATVWILGLPLSALLGARTQSWMVAVLAFAVLVTALLVFSERGDRIGVWIRKTFSPTA